jgi:hypothetical protein
MSADSDTRTSRRRWPWIVGAGVLGLVVFVLVWFQPQKLFIDDRVDEAIPAATPRTTTPVTEPGRAGATATTVPTPTGPVEVTRGDFVSLDHGTRGAARVLDLADGRRVVRLEGLDTSNGPDLYVYLTAEPAAGSEDRFDDDYVNLGRLKGNQGNQNYDLPADADLGRYSTVLIWCDRFNSAFGAADLAAA